MLRAIGQWLDAFSLKKDLIETNAVGLLFQDGNFAVPYKCKDKIDVGQTQGVC